MIRMEKYGRKMRLALLFVICVLAAFLMRTWHYNTSVYELGKRIGDVPAETLKAPTVFPAYHPNFAPFTIESGMMFTYSQDIAEGKSVPERDPLLNGQEHIPPYAQMSMGLEWFLGYGWRLKNKLFPDPAPSADELRFQDHPRMAQWMSGQLRLWASLTSGLILLWLAAMGCPLKFAFPAALLHAFSPAAIARSTGQDFVRGEFCIPLIVATFWLAWSIYRRPKAWKYAVLFCTSTLAFATWDLCQMLFGAWTCFEILRFTLGRRMTKMRLYVFLTLTAAILFNAAFVPVSQAYQLWRAQMVWTALPTFFLMWILANRLHPAVWWKRIAAAAEAFLILYGVWNVCINTPEYQSIYSHFYEAMHAKLQYWNVKPLNPEKLTYDARILWTPSMTSTTWESANTFFPSLYQREIPFRPLQFVLGYLPLGLGLFTVLLAGTFLFTPVRREVKRNSESSLLPILFTLGFIPGFIYIIRYHEFLIIFLVMSLALLCRDYARAWKPRKLHDAVYPWMNVYRHKILCQTLRFLPFVLFLAVLTFEFYFSGFALRRYYTGDVAMKETAHLIEWFRREPEKFKGKGVAASITIGPMLRAYAGTGVVMNPQFGLKCIRDATEEYIMTLYHGSENDLADFCRRRRAEYLVIIREDPDQMPVILTGAIAQAARTKHQREQMERAYTAAWIYSSRYIANALHVPENAVYRNLYKASDPDSPDPAQLHQFTLVRPPDDLRFLSKSYAVFHFQGEGGKKP